MFQGCGDIKTRTWMSSARRSTKGFGINVVVMMPFRKQFRSFADKRTGYKVPFDDVTLVEELRALINREGAFSHAFVWKQPTGRNYAERGY